MTQVSFPGIFGINTVFNINPVAFTVFGREIRWYGILICLGIILSVMNAVKYAKKEGISTDDVLDFAIWTIPLSIVGARAYYVLTSLSEYHSIYDAIAVWNGGLAIYGGIIAGVITVFIVSKVKKISFLKFGDAASISVFIGQAIGRWGNFCNGEAFGHLDRIEFLGKVIKTPYFEKNFFLRMQLNSEVTFGTQLVHPTFLYESLWNILGFIVVSFVYKKKKFDGQIILCYFGWYGLGRFFIEGLRSDSLYLGSTNIKISQLLALCAFVVSVALLLFFAIKRKSAVLNSKEYVNLYSANADENSENQTDDIANSTQATNIEQSNSAEKSANDVNTKNNETEEIEKIDLNGENNENSTLNNEEESQNGNID